MIHIKCHTLFLFYFFWQIRRLVQGEAMKKTSKWKRNSGCPVQILFMAGFLLGMILPNILWRMEWHQKTIASIYLLNTFGIGSEEREEYFFQVLKMRGSEYLLGAAGGISVFGVPFAVVGSIYLGVKTGILLTMSILQFGFQGGLIGIGLLFPQYLFYIPCIFYLYRQSYDQSMKIWKNRGMFSGEVAGYFLRITLCGLLYLAGVITEVYCNPYILEWMIKKIGIL